MTRLDELLRPLLDDEAQRPGPTPEVAAECWQRIAADLGRGALPPIDVPPPAAPRSTTLWIALAVLGAAMAAAVLYTLLRADIPAAIEPPASAPVVVLAPPAPPQPVAEPVDRAPVLAPSPASAPPEEPAREVPVPGSLAPPSPRPRPRPIRSAALTPTDEDTFAAELRLLAQGHAALSRHDFAEALQVADKHRRTYPKGHFLEDRDALRALALCGAGDAKAAEAVRRFLRAHPDSIHAVRVQDACDREAHEQPSTRSQP